MSLPTKDDYYRVLNDPDLFNIALNHFHLEMRTRFGYRNHHGKLISELNENMFALRLKEGPFKHIKRLEVMDNAVRLAIDQSHTDTEE